MGLITLGRLGTQTISQSETDTLNITLAGTLDVAGPVGAAPIEVTLSQVTNVAGVATINISNANLHLNGAIGVSLAVTYNIGDNSTLDFQNVTSVGVGTAINFTGATGTFRISTVYTPTAGTTFSGFGPGKQIDIVSSAVSSVTYTDNSGSNTGGTLTVFGPNGVVLNSIPLSNGDFIGKNFGLLADGSGGTLIDFASFVNSVTATSATPTVGRNGVVTITVAMSNPVSVTGGVPTLALNDGGTAVYDTNSSTPTQMVYKYTALSGQNTNALSIISTALNGATVTPVGGGVINSLGIVGALANTIAVDTFAPAITSITTSPSSGYLSAGQIVSFAVALDEPIVMASGSPTLLLNDGGTATYDAADSTATNLVFKHTVQAGQNSADLSILGANYNGSNLADAAGNIVSLASFVDNPLGTLVVDTIAPTIASVTTSPGSGAVIAGQGVIFNVVPSEAVLVTSGTPTLLLNDGGTATYDALSSTATNLVFRHTIQPGQTASDLSVIGTNLNGANIADLAGNLFNLANAVGNPAGVLSVGASNVTEQITSTPVAAPVTTPITTTSTTNATDTIYRFFETTNGTHFYTESASERDSILQTRPDLILESGGLRAVDPASSDAAATQVFRFFDTTTGTQFLTASQSERDSIISNRPDLKYEPEGTFLEHVTPQANDTPVYRFFSNTDGTHFYTDNSTERANIIQTRPDLVAEGLGFYEPAST